MKQEKKLGYYLIFSLIGAVLILMFFFISEEKTRVQFTDKIAVTGAFIFSCILGISFAVKPNWIKRFKRRNGYSNTDSRTKIQPRVHRGHHPDCGKFRGHVVRMKNKIYCAGCFGILLGCIISIFLAILYVVFFNEIQKGALYLLIITGMFIVLVNYMETLLPNRKAMVHIIFNVFLMVGIFFIIIGIFQLTGNLILSIFALIISFLWIDTRIHLSLWHHFIICRDCTQQCKEYDTLI